MPHRPSLRVRTALSVLVALHFLFLFTALVAPPMPGAAAATLAGVVYGRLSRHYLEPLYLTSPHRYYAPEIAPFSQVWFRVGRVDGKAEWFELPGKRETWTPMRYQRRFGISMALEAAGPGEKLSPLGRILVDSYARHVLARMAEARNEVRTVQIYQVLHRVRTPEEVRRGWLPLDLRLYSPRFLGAYDAIGKLVSRREVGTGPGTFFVPISEFAASVLREDAEPGIAASRLPAPLADLLTRFPELERARKSDDLRQTLRKLVAGVEEPDASEW